MQEILIKDLPKEERPRERLIQNGAGSLSNAELLAIILRIGTKKQSVVNLSNAILKKSEGLKGLNDIRVDELTEIPGVGDSKAVQIIASIELGKRIFKASSLEHKKEFYITSPSEGYSFIAPDMQYLTQEHFVVVFLDVKNKVIAKETIFIGSLDRAIVHPREIFREAIKRLSASIICFHNHPSGDVVPSNADIDITKRLVSSGEIIGIKVVDHIIIGSEGYSSLKMLGYMD